MKLVADNRGVQYGYNTQTNSAPLKVQLAIFDRNQKSFQNQYEQQSLPTVVGQTEVLKMSEFWGAQNYGPVLFHFTDNQSDKQSKLLIVVAGGKQKTREKMKERLKAGIDYLKSLSDGESSDMSPPIHDGSDGDGEGESHDYKLKKEELMQAQARQLEELKNKQAEQLRQFQEEQRREQQRNLHFQQHYAKQMMQESPTLDPPENNNYVEPDYEGENIWKQSELFCPAAPLKFIDMLQQDWFTPREISQSGNDPGRRNEQNSDFGLLHSNKKENNEKKRKLSDGPQVQDSIGVLFFIFFHEFFTILGLSFRYLNSFQ